jgi:plastocyanin
MRKKVFTGLFLVALCLEASRLSAGPANVVVHVQPKAKMMEINIDNFSFGPAELTVSVGTTVTWTNRDDIPHTVVSTDKVFKSKVLDTNEKFSYTFSTPGAFSYFCSIHPKMTGTVMVQ